jgi:hypothetical protein
MKIYHSFLMGLIFLYDQKKMENYSIVKLENGNVNSEFLQKIMSKLERRTTNLIV